MESLTLSIAILVSILVLWLRPDRAFALYIVALLWYPGFLVVRLGVIDINAARIVVGVLLMRCLANTRMRRDFKWCRLDSWVLLGLIVTTVIPALSYRRPLMDVLENRSGFLMNTFMAYFVARFCVTSRSDVITVIKLVGIALVPLACLGVVETYSGWQPFAVLKMYCPWAWPGETMSFARFGLHRAVGPLGHPILFGFSFVLFLPMIYALRHVRDNWGKLAYALSGVACIGALCSLSSGPWMMLGITVVCLVLEHFKKWVKLVIIFAIFSCFMVGIISNRPFYHVIVSYANPMGGTGWHRAKLLDLAIENFDEWWFVGYRGLSPEWGQYLGMSWTDVTSEFISWAVQYGILGVVAFCGVFTSALLKLRRLHSTVSDPMLKSLYWSLGSIVVVLMISLNGFSLFGQALSFFFCVLGMIGSSASFQVACENSLSPSTVVVSRADADRRSQQTVARYYS